MKKELLAIKDFLDESYLKYNTNLFIESDPISIPRKFSKKEDIEIAGFLSATIAWGNRKSIISNGEKLMKLMDNAPHDFIINHNKNELKPLEKFVHRTFNGKDCLFFVKSLQNIYKNFGGLENSFGGVEKKFNGCLKNRLIYFRTLFLETQHLARSEKHISNPIQKSSAKRLCMYLRWMVRQDKKGVDFGIWKSISSQDLCLPLDVHTGNVSRILGLLKRKQNDWQAVEEITDILKSFDAKDPIKYDFALFGLGIDGALKESSKLKL